MANLSSNSGQGNDTASASANASNLGVGNASAQRHRCHGNMTHNSSRSGYPLALSPNKTVGPTGSRNATDLDSSRNVSADVNTSAVEVAAHDRIAAAGSVAGLGLALPGTEEQSMGLSGSSRSSSWSFWEFALMLALAAATMFIFHKCKLRVPGLSSVRQVSMRGTAHDMQVTTNLGDWMAADDDDDVTVAGPLSGRRNAPGRPSLVLPKSSPDAAYFDLSTPR